MNLNSKYRMLRPMFTMLLIAMLINRVNAQSADPRNVHQGKSIYENGYIDQPYVVVLKDGRWLCVFTTSNGEEGSNGQHIVATISADKGTSWSSPVDIEPKDGPAASWAIPYLTSTGRVYVFYDYNGQNVTTLNGELIRNDMLGWYCYKFSDDNGQSWSKRYRLPVRKTTVDLNNDWKGEVQIMWGISKPIKANNSIYFAFTKLGKYMLDLGEGWFFKSDNIDTEQDPDKIRWQMLPEGDKGLRNPALGSVQEEQNIVSLTNGDLYCIYRTTLGFPAQAYSRDQGKTWTMPEAATYSPGGRVFKHPRACPKIFKCKNGKYLFWFHNYAGSDYTGRNPAWISGGIEKNGFIYWSQPEILLYDDDLKVRMSYPDLIEQDGKYWLTETQKIKGRVHEIKPQLLDGLWNQAVANTVTSKGLIVNEDGLQSKKTVDLTVLPDLKEGGFSIELWLNFKDLKPGQVVLDSRNEQGKGIWLTTSEQKTLHFEMSDGSISQGWDTYQSVLQPDKLHHITFIVDGAPNIITVEVDGKLCDGGAQQYGWGRFSDKLGDVNGTTAKLASSLHGAINCLRVYNRYLTTSEAISNYHAGINKKRRNAH